MAHAATLGLVLHHHVRGPRLNYFELGLAAVVSWLWFAGPGEAALIAAGISASSGRLDLASVLATAWLGATLGGVGGWMVGRYGGRRLMLAGSWLRRSRERALEHGNRFFERYGWVAVYFAPSWAAGINAMSFGRFLPANAAGALVWSLLIGVGSYLVGPSVRDVVDDVGLFGALAIVVLAVAGYILTRRRMSRRAQRRAG